MSARAETFSEFQFMLSSNSLNVSAPVLTAAHASRDIQRIRINFHSDSLHLSARVLISHDLLSVRFSCAREPRHSSQIAKLKTRAETSNALGTAEYGAPEMSTRAEFSFLGFFNVFWRMPRRISIVPDLLRPRGPGKALHIRIEPETLPKKT